MEHFHYINLESKENITHYRIYKYWTGKYSGRKQVQAPTFIQK